MKFNEIIEDCDCQHKHPAELDEAGAGPTRIVQHIHAGTVFIMLSAMRADLPQDENKRRTKKLKYMLASMPVTFIETTGEYHETGQDKPSIEHSFFVMPRRGKIETMPQQFRNIGVKLMGMFDQDSILFGDGETATLIFNDGGTLDLGDAVTFRPEVIQNLGGFSKIKGRPFSFTDRDTAKADVKDKPAKTAGVIYGQARKAA